MPFNFIRTSFPNKKIGVAHKCEIILDLEFQDSAISASKSDPAVFTGNPKPFDSRAITFQARSLDEVTYAANNCFIGRGEKFGLTHIFADRVLTGSEMDNAINEAGAKFVLPMKYKTGYSGLAQVTDCLFMPVRPHDIVLDKATGAVTFTQGVPTKTLA